MKAKRLREKRKMRKGSGKEEKDRKKGRDTREGGAKRQRRKNRG